MSGAEDALLDGADTQATGRDSGETLINGLFYGALAYFVGYVWVYANIRGEDIPNQAAAAMYENETSMSSERYEEIELLIPDAGEYAGWVYHYALGGSINVSTNLTPGSTSLNDSVLYHFEPPSNLSRECGQIVPLRDTVLNHPWTLISPSNGHCYIEISQNADAVAEMSFVFVTPTALFLAGFFLAYRHGELTPLGGALAGAKVTAGFLLASLASVYLFTVTVSGITLGAEGGVSAQVIGLSLSTEVQPEIEIGPSMSRAIIIGIVYPLAFATLGGAAASGTTVIRLPTRLLQRYLGR